MSFGSPNMKVWIAELLCVMCYVLLLYYYFPIHSPLDFAENEKKKKKKDEYMAFNDHLSDFSNPTSCLPGFFCGLRDCSLKPCTKCLFLWYFSSVAVPAVPSAICCSLSLLPLIKLAVSRSTADDPSSPCFTTKWLQSRNKQCIQVTKWVFMFMSQKSQASARRIGADFSISSLY